MWRSASCILHFYLFKYLVNVKSRLNLAWKLNLMTWWRQYKVNFWYTKFDTRNDFTNNCDVSETTTRGHNTFPVVKQLSLSTGSTEANIKFGNFEFFKFPCPYNNLPTSKFIELNIDLHHFNALILTAVLWRFENVVSIISINCALKILGILAHLRRELTLASSSSIWIWVVERYLSSVDTRKQVAVPILRNTLGGGGLKLCYARRFFYY